MGATTFIGIIPARYASTRFPGKPLAELGGCTVIERVYRRVASVLGENVAVATDDDRIRLAVEAFGGKAVMTSAEHRSGTDRCLEAYRNLGSKADVVINIRHPLYTHSHPGPALRKRTYVRRAREPQHSQSDHRTRRKRTAVQPLCDTIYPFGRTYRMARRHTVLHPYRTVRLPSRHSGRNHHPAAVASRTRRKPRTTALA